MEEKDKVSCTGIELYLEDLWVRVEDALSLPGEYSRCGSTIGQAVQFSVISALSFGTTAALQRL